MGVDVVMLAKISEELTDKQIKQLSYKISEAIGHNQFWAEPKKGTFALVRTDDEYDYERLPRDISQTGTLLSVQTTWRYYGPGYTRGPWPTIAATIEWLKRNGFDVYYGGDGGQPLFLMDAVAMENIWDCFAKTGYSIYQGGFTSKDRQYECPYCEGPTYNYMVGDYGKTLTNGCPGCGTRYSTEDGGQHWTEVETK